MAGDPKKLIKNLLEAGEFEAPDSTVNQIAQEWGNDYKGLVKSLLDAGEFEYGDQEVNALLSDFGLAGSPTPYAPNAVPVDLTFGLAPGLVTPLGSQTKPPKQEPKKAPVVPPGAATTGPVINWGTTTVSNINPVTGQVEPPKKKKTEVKTEAVTEPPKAAIPPGAATMGPVIDWGAATVAGPTTGPITGPTTGPTIGLPRQTGTEVFGDPLLIAEANDVKIKEAERIKKQIGEERFNIYRDPTNEFKPVEGSERDVENKALLDQYEKSINDILEATNQNIGLFLNDPEWRPKYEALVGRANDISDKAEALSEKIKQKSNGVSPLNTEGIGESLKELRLGKDKQDELREKLNAKREEIAAFKAEAQSRAANFTTQEDLDAYVANVEAIFKNLKDEEDLLADEFNAIYEQLKPHIEKVESYERKSKEEASKFSNDPDVKLFNSYVSDLKKLYDEIDVYRSAPDFPKFAKTYEEAYKNKDVRKNLFKSEAEAKKEADALRLYVEKLQKIRDFDKKYKGRSEFDDVLDDVVNFLRPAGLPVGKLSSFKRTLQSAAIESFVKPILGGLAWISDSVTDNPYPSRYLRYGDNFSLQRMSEIQTGIEGAIPSKYQGDFLEKNFVIKKGDPLTSILPEGTKVITRGDKNDIVGFRDEDGYVVNSLLDPKAIETIKNHINSNKDKVENDMGVFRGVLKTIPSALDFALLMAGAPGLARGLVASPLKLSRTAAAASSTFAITMAQQIGRSYESYLRQGNDTDKAALFAFGETAAVASVETFMSPIESKLISKGLGADDLAKFRKIKDTTIADIATGRVGLMDALGNLWRASKEFLISVGQENVEEFVQQDIQDFLQYVASGKEINTSFEDRINTVFSTSLITFLPAIGAGVSAYRNAKADLITTSLWNASKNRESFEKDLRTFVENKQIEEIDAQYYKSVVKYIDEELQSYDNLTKEQEVGISALIATRFNLELKSSQVENQNAKKRYKDQIEEINKKIEDVVGKKTPVEVSPEVQDMLSETEAAASPEDLVDIQTNSQETLTQLQADQSRLQDLQTAITDNNNAIASGNDPILTEEQVTDYNNEINILNQKIKDQQNAIQEQSTTTIPFQPGTQVSEGVGGQVQAEPEVTTGEVQVETEGQVAEEKVTGLVKDDQFDNSADTKSFVGSFVDYQGVRGVLLEDGQGNIIVDTGQGDVLVEGALSDMTNKDLGLSRAERAEISDEDVQKIEQDVAANIDPTVIQTDFGTGRIFYGNREFKYESSNLDKDGNTVSIDVTDANGKKKTIRNKQAVEEIELQKMIFEDLLNNNKITLDNEFARQFQAQATNLGIKPTITAPQRVERRAQPVQQVGPAEGVKGPEAKPAAVAQEQEEVTAEAAPVEIKGFEVKKKDGTTVPPSNYRKNPNTGKWVKVNEQGKATPVSSPAIVQQLEDEQARLQQQPTQPKTEPTPTEVAETPIPKNKVRASFNIENAGRLKTIQTTPAFKNIFSEEQLKNLKVGENTVDLNMTAWGKAQRMLDAKDVTKEAGVEKTEQKAETKPETTTTKPAQKAQVAEPAPAKKTPTKPKKEQPKKEEPTTKAKSLNQEADDLFDSLFDTEEGATAQGRTSPPEGPIQKGDAVLPTKEENQSAIDALAAFLKEAGITVTVLDSLDFKQKAQGNGMSGPVEGLFIVEDDSGKVYLNRDKIEGEWGKTIIFHEGIHPVINIIRNTNPKLFNSILKGIKAEAKKNLNLETLIKDVSTSEQLKGKPQEIIDDEIIVETLARIASGRLRLSEIKPTLKDMMVNFYNKIATYLKLPKISNLSTDQQFRDFAIKLSDAIQKGGKLSELVGDENIHNYVFDISIPGVISYGQMSSGIQRVADPIDEIYKDKNIKSLPKRPLQDIYDSFGGNVVVINSDPTRVGKLKLQSGNEIFMYGGPGYLAVEDNVNGNVGFATTQFSKVKNWSDYVKEVFGDQPGVTLVATQSPNSLLSNSYSLRYVLDAVFQLPESVKTSPEFRKEFFGEDLATLKNAFGEGKFNDFLTKYGDSDFTNSENIEKMISEMSYKIGTANTGASFVARSSFLSNLLGGIKPNKGGKGYVSVDPKKYISKKLMDNFGINAEKVMRQIGHENIVDLYMKEGIWGLAVSGFETDPGLSIESVQEQGVLHPLFNAKFPGVNPFLLEGAYEVDAMFPAKVLKNPKYKTGVYVNKASTMLSGSMYVKGGDTQKGFEFKPDVAPSTRSIQFSAGINRTQVPDKVLPSDLEIVKGWYSPIEKRLLETKIGKQSANKWLTSGLIGKGDEATYTGVKGWLESKNPQEQVDKKDILDWMRNNRVKIKQTYSDEYSGWQLDGDKSDYKVILVTLPGKTTSLNDISIDLYGVPFDQLQAEYPSSFESKRDRVVEVRDRTLESGEGGKKFMSGHFAEPNILVHLRMNTRSDAEGNKILFLEEIQSDWAQEGREMGFEDPVEQERYEEFQKDREDYQKLLDEVRDERSKVIENEEFQKTIKTFEDSEYFIGTNFKGDGNKYVYKEEPGKSMRDYVELTDEEIPSEIKKAFDVRKKITEKLDKLENKKIEYENKYGVEYDAYDTMDLVLRSPVFKLGYTPTAPFVTNTNAWVKLGLKIALREAVKRGVSKIAWTTGEQQLNRYPTLLSRGKEGMTAFYDKIVPDVAKSLLKELTGKSIEIGETNIETTKYKSRKFRVVIYDSDGDRAFWDFNTEEEAKMFAEGRGGTVTIKEAEISTQQSISLPSELKTTVVRGIPQFSAGIKRESTEARVLPEGLSITEGWYSPIEKRLLETKVDKLSANRWLNDGFIGRGDEATYTGVRGWLESKNPQEQVSKKDIIEWIKNNRVEISEVINNKEGNELRAIQEEIRKMHNRFAIEELYWVDELDFESEDNIGSYYYETPEDLIDHLEFIRTEKDALKDRFDELDEEITNVTNYNQDYRDYQTDGFKTNYKEILVTLNKRGIFKSSHFEDANVLVHLRTNIREDEDGNKVLFLEELQSDWGQEGRREGFRRLELNDQEKNKIKSLRKEQKEILNGLKSYRLLKSLAEPELAKIDFVNNEDPTLEALRVIEGIISHVIDNPYYNPNDSYSVERGMDRILNAIKNQFEYFSKPQFTGGKEVKLDFSEKDLLDIIQAYNEDSLNGRVKIEAYDSNRRSLKELEKVQNIELDILNISNAPISEGNVLPAPYVTNTNDWIKLGLKVALREAISQGATKIAWTTGEQQYERWGSEKIDWVSRGERNKAETRRMNELIKKVNSYTETTPSEREELTKLVNKEGWSISIRNFFSGADISTDYNKIYENGTIISSKTELEEALSTDLLDKTENEIEKLTDKIWDMMQNGPKQNTLLPRREGMKAFYDKQIPSVIGSLVKELTGKTADIVTTSIQKLETDFWEAYNEEDGWFYHVSTEGALTDSKEEAIEELGEELRLRKELNGSSNILQQQSIEITPELKSSVVRGIPQFSAGINRGTFDARNPGPKGEQAFIKDKNALIEGIKKKIAAAAPNKPYKEMDFIKDMAGRGITITPEDATLLFKRATVPNTLPRTSQRILETAIIPENIKDAIVEQTKPKQSVTDEDLEVLADGVLEEADMAESDEEAVKIYEQTVNDIIDQLGPKFSRMLLGEGQLIYELRVLKKIAEALKNMGNMQGATDVLQIITNFGSISGRALREMSMNNSADAIYITTLSKNADSKNQAILDSPVSETSRKTNRQATEEISKAASKSMEENAAEIAANAAAKATTEKAKQDKKREREQTTTEKLYEASKAISKKATEKLNEFKSLMSQIKGLGFAYDPKQRAELLADASKAFLMYAYYKTSGSIVKARIMFLEMAELKPAHKDVDKYIEELNQEEFPNATKEIAKLKVLEALQEDDRQIVKSPTPAQLIARRIKAIDRKNERVKPRPKTLEQRIQDLDLDITTLTELRDAIEAELMPLEESKRAEVMSKVEDLLAELKSEKLKKRAAPWITKTQIRKDFRDGLKSLEETISDIIKDMSKIDVYTKSLTEEFIKRTGMTADEAAPFIKIIQDEINKVVDTKIKSDIEKQMLESFSENRDDITDAIKNKKAEIDYLEGVVAALVAKEKTPLEVEMLRANKKKLKDAKAKLNVFENKLKKFDDTASKQVKSGNFYRILKALKSNGLNSDTVVNAFAESLGLDVLQREELDRINFLTQKIKNAITSADEEAAVKDLKKYIYAISDTNTLDQIVRMLESYVYANMLSSWRTAEVAFFSGIVGLTKDVFLNLAFAILKDIGNVSPITYSNGVKFRSPEIIPKNTLIVLNSLLDIINSNRIFDFRTAFDVLKGAEGISMQELDLTTKQKDRLSSSLNEIEKASALIDKIKEIDNWFTKPKALSSYAALQAFIFQQRMARALVVGDYMARSAAIPYAIRMTTAEEAMKSLPVGASFLDIYRKSSAIMNRAKAKELAEIKAAQLAAEGKSFDKKRYERKIAVEMLPPEIQKQVVEYADRLAWTGRIAGKTGYAANTFNNFIEFIKGEPIGGTEEAPTKETTGSKSLKTIRTLLALATKFTVMPFPNVQFRGAQMIKNATPFGIWQTKVVKDENGKYVSVPGYQLFSEYRYYNGINKVYDVTKAADWQAQSRIATGFIPMILAGWLFTSLFNLKFDDDEEDKKYDESGYADWDLILNAFNGDKVSFEVDSNSDYFVTGDYDPDVKTVFEAKGAQYEPFAIYKKDDKGIFKKIPILGSYKDAPYGVYLNGLSAAQERLLLAKEVKGSGKATRDPLSVPSMFAIMGYGAVGFLGEFGLSGATDNLKILFSIFGDDTKALEQAEGSFQRIGKTLTRQLAPQSAFSSWVANVKGMVTGDDKRKGIGWPESALANTYVWGDFVDTYDYDALGKRIPYQESPYPVLGPLERAVASINNFQYSFLNSTVFESRITNPDRIRTKFIDLAGYIRKMGSDDVVKTEMTVVSLGNEESRYYMGLEAANNKFQMLDENYEYLNSLEGEDGRKDLAKIFRSINSKGNEHAFCNYVLNILENNADKFLFSTGMSVSELRNAIATIPQDGIGLIEKHETTKKGVLKYYDDNTPVMKPAYYKKSKLVDILYNNKIHIKSNGEIIWDRNYSEIYNKDVHEEYMLNSMDEDGIE